MELFNIIEQQKLAKLLIAKMHKKNLKLAIAESCTGGMISTILTSVPGASNVFDRGLITYSNKSKIQLLGVKENSLKNYGAVSKEVVKEMVKGLLNISDANIALSISGVAGPGSINPKKPEGLVWIAFGTKNSTIKTIQFNFGIIGRDNVRKKSSIKALSLLLDFLDSN